MSSDCCFKGFLWGQEPTGRETTFACGNKTYITSNDNNGSFEDTGSAILLIHDLFGWTFRNTRILADSLAKETGATVYVPDYFNGEVMSPEILNDFSRWHELDIPGVQKRHSKTIRYPEILACAKELRRQYQKLGTIGYCYGGWAVFRLGAEKVPTVEDGNDTQSLVDCISTAHPSWLTKEEISNVRCPVQVLSPVHDIMLTAELKDFLHVTIPSLELPFDYQLFPEVEHGFAVRGNQADEKELKAMDRAKGAAAHWFKTWLSGH